MADPVSLLLGPILNKLIDAAIGLVTEKIILLAGLHDNIKNLSNVLERIKYVLQDAEQKQVKSRELRSWLKKLRDAAYDAEDALELFVAKVHQSKQKHNVLEWFRISAAETIDELLKRFNAIEKEIQKFDLQKVGIPESNIFVDRDPTGHHLNESDVVGRDVDKEAIINALVTKSSSSSNDFDVISITGIGGSGKTTLAQLVFNDPRINGHFDIYKMWVCVNVNFDLDRILREMIKYHSKMANDDRDLSRSQLQSRLKAFLENNRFLLVLDDVWTENFAHWDSLKQLLEIGASGSRVLVTCRNIKVTTMMSTGPEPLHLSNLAEEESWQLFRKNAFVNGQAIGELEEIGRKIIRKCNGLPLAIKAVAGLLRSVVEVTVWKRILMHEIWELEEQDSQENNLKVLTALKLSFDHLPSDLKPCFLFCSIFPKGHPFVKSELVKMWMANDFIIPRGREKPEDTGDNCFDKLLGRSFFQFLDVSRDKTYRMHDLIHDLAWFISGPDSFHHIITETSCKTEDNSRHVSVQCENVAKPVSYLITKSKKVRTLLLGGGNVRDFGKMLDDLFRKLTYIRVLDLSSSSIDVIPDSIQELQLLRYLDLSKTDIKLLHNSICRLWNLQTLRLLRCLWLHELPEDLAKLTSLRHLEVDGIFWHKLSRLSGGVSSLKNLHNLQKFWVAKEKGYGVEQLQDLTNLTETLHLLRLENTDARDAELDKKTKLLKVVFQWTKTDDGASQNEETQERTLLELQPHHEVKELGIIYFGGRRLPTWFIDGSLKKLTIVSLSHCNSLEQLSMRQLPYPRFLYLKGMSKLEECHESEWPSLKLLKVSGCPKLRSLPVSLFQLESLKIKGCDSLKVLPFTAHLMFLRLVDNAVLEDWKELLLQITVPDDQGNQTTSHHWSLERLTDVKIIRCPMLKQLPKYFCPRKLDISDCDNLKGLPPLQYSQWLKHLSLDTSNDGTLLSLIPECPSLDTLVISNISAITSFPKFPLLPGVKALYIRACADLEHLWEGEGNSNNLNSLPSLQLLSIQNCPKLKTLPKSGLPTTLTSLSIDSCPNLQKLGPRHMIKTVTSLSDIYLQNCESLKHLPEGGFPDSLRHLKIHDCPIIAERCRQDDGVDWSKISHVPDLDTDFFKMNSSSGSANNVLVQPQASSSTSTSTSKSTSKRWFTARFSGCTSQDKDVVTPSVRHRSR